MALFTLIVAWEPTNRRLSAADNIRHCYAAGSIQGYDPTFETL